MGEVDLIICLRERMREGQRVVAACETVPLTLEAVLEVTDVAANSMPG